MSEKHLELEDALSELSGAVSELQTEQELRDRALTLAIHTFLKPSLDFAPGDVTTLAKGYYTFLSADGSDD